MTANTNFVIKYKDPSGTDVGTWNVVPSRVRQGVYEYKATASSADDGYFDNTVGGRLTSSVRQGNPANYVTGTARIKRKLQFRAELPISVPGESGDIIDFIVADVTISAPVESVYTQYDNVLRLIHSALNAAYNAGDTPLDDMLVSGVEPW